MKSKSDSAVAAAPGRLLSRRQAAEIIGCKPNTLAVWACQKKGPPFIRVTAQIIRYSEPALNAWLAERNVFAKA